MQFPLKDYQTEQEIEERKGRTMKDYCNFLKHNADARRAQHGGKGVAARRRTNGVISYEARISKHNVGVSVPHSVCIPRALWVRTCVNLLQHPRLVRPMQSATLVLAVFSHGSEMLFVGFSSGSVLRLYCASHLCMHVLPAIHGE